MPILPENIPIQPREMAVKERAELATITIDASMFSEEWICELVKEYMESRKERRSCFVISVLLIL